MRSGGSVSEPRAMDGALRRIVSGTVAGLAAAA